MCFRILSRHRFSVFFFFNDTATTEIYTLSLHDALPISVFGLDGEAAEEELGLGQLRLTFGQAEQAGARPFVRLLLGVVTSQRQARLLGRRARRDASFELGPGLTVPPLRGHEPGQLHSGPDALGAALS